MVSAAVFQRSQCFPVAFRCGSNHGQLCVGVTAAQQRKRHDRRNNERDESSFSHIFLSIFSYFVCRSDFPSNRSKSAHFSCKMFDIFRVSWHFPSMKSLFYAVNFFLQIFNVIGSILSCKFSIILLTHFFCEFPCFVNIVKAAKFLIFSVYLQLNNPLVFDK